MAANTGRASGERNAAHGTFRRWVIVLCLVILGLAVPLPLRSTGAATENERHVVAVVSHGVRLSLTVPRRTYPAGALVQFTIALANVSRHNRYLEDWPPDWGGPYSPHVRMRTKTGHLVYEEELSAFLAPTPGTLANDYVLRPGRSRAWHVRFVLQAPQVQAIERVFDGYTAYRLAPGSPPPSELVHHQWRIETPFLTLRLTHEPAPRVIVTRRGTLVHATVRPAWPVSGMPLFMDSTRCWTGPSTMWTDQHLPWTRAPHNRFGTIIHLPCPSREPWRAVVGWPGHRVAYLDYPDLRQLH